MTTVFFVIAVDFDRFVGNIFDCHLDPRDCMSRDDGLPDVQSSLIYLPAQSSGYRPDYGLVLVPRTLMPYVTDTVRWKLIRIIKIIINHNNTLDLSEFERMPPTVR